MEKDSILAKISFILSMFFWVPLLNNFLAIAAIITGIKALKQIKSNPEAHGGRRWAVAGIVMGALVLIIYVLGKITNTG